MDFTPTGACRAETLDFRHDRLDAVKAKATAHDQLRQAFPMAESGAKARQARQAAYSVASS
jgi:hypothetical protein